MNKAAIQKRVQHLVMNNLFSEWDDTKSFPKILESIKDQDFEIAYPWEPVEDIDPQILANMVCDLTSGIIFLMDQILGETLKENKQLKDQLKSACNALMERGLV